MQKIKKYKKKRYNRRRRKFKKSLKKHHKPKYNPTWNPQYMKVKRKIDFLVPSADLSRGTYGVYQYLSVQPAATTMAYSSVGYNFLITDIYNVNEFGLMFDQYKITGVKLQFKYITASDSVLSMSTNAQGQTCELLVLHDWDDVSQYAATNAGWLTACETGRAYIKMFPSKKNTLTYYVKPKLLTPAVDASSTTTARYDTNAWVDGAANPPPYNGIKAMLRCPPNVTTTFVHTIACTATYYTMWRSRQ